MVVCTGVAVATVLTGGTAAVIGAGVGASAGSGAAAVGTGAAIGTAVGSATAGGAIAGASTGSVMGAAVGAVAGGTSAAGVGGSGVGLGAIVVGTGGWGLLAIGTSVKPEGDQTTYDCWKPVVHDKSEDPSDGILMKDLVSHPHVAKVTITEGICTDLPHIILENVWKEMFEIEYLLLHDTGKIVCHAKPVL